MGKRKHTIIISEKLDEEVTVYIKNRAVQIIASGGKIPSRSQLFEELLTKGLHTPTGRRK